MGRPSLVGARSGKPKVEARITSRETKSPTLSKVRGWGGGQELKACPAMAHGRVRSRGETWQEIEAGALLSGDEGGRGDPLGVCARGRDLATPATPGHTAYSRKQGEGP